LNCLIFVEKVEMMGRPKKVVDETVQVIELKKINIQLATIELVR